ncbi:DUF433 domain-containing protein [Euzebya tangerina]|uniref:DUF433 domain-containing protein n=1 Tax=Euzebya tangerina TaxID=591198 RepID=UPI000E31927F
MTGDQVDLIVRDPDVLHGQAHIRGTRIPVSVVLDCLGSGLTERDIMSHYPSFGTDGVSAVSAYAAALAREEVLPLLA